MSDEPSFYITENTAKAKFDISKPAKSAVYNGPEKRKRDRRCQTDRRGDVRFELDKEDRRKKEGRRKSDATPTYY
jgi:hypothetical protein